MDLVTVFYNTATMTLAQQLSQELVRHEEGRHHLVQVNNCGNPRTFAAAQNHGSRMGHNNGVIGFLNPDTRVIGPFVQTVEQAFRDNPRLVITGCRFNKPQREIEWWGCQDWVCGAAMFVRHSWFQGTGGFDETYVWAWEETDLIRKAQLDGMVVRSLGLPLQHESPRTDSPEVVLYKQTHMVKGHRYFHSKWKCKCIPPQSVLLSPHLVV